MQTKKMRNKPIAAVASFAAIAALAACSGCASISTTKVGRLDGVAVKGVDGRVSEHVCLKTSVEHIFWTLPIASGAFYWNEKTRQLETETKWFRDCAGVAELQEALQKYADSRNCDIADVAFFDADVSYAGASYEGLLGILFGSSDMGVSAVLVPRKATANDGGL